MITHDTPIPDLKLLQFERLTDNRGSFYRLYCDRELREVTHGAPIVQINHSLTQSRGGLRGLHMQCQPSADIRIVRCVRGEVFDVAVDLRSNSSHLLRWHGVNLSADNDLAMVIPKGFAHGFQVIDPDSELLYLHTAYYEPASERGVLYNDPQINIEWPLDVTDISDRDASHALLEAGFTGIPV